MKQDVAAVSSVALARVGQNTLWVSGAVGRALGGLLALLTLGGCVHPPRSGDDSPADEAAKVRPDHERSNWRLVVSELLRTPEGGEPWQPFLLPGKRFADFELITGAGKPVLSVQADRSVSILRRRFAEPMPAVSHIDFSWKVDGLPEGANLSDVDLGDAPVRILLSFDGDRSKWSARNHRLSDMSRLLTGEELPYATLMYVWSTNDATDSVVVNPRTDRIRKVVVESGAAQLGRWRQYRRDVHADFLRAFGEEPGPLRAVALMTDTDNTRSRLRAWYGPMSLAGR